MLRGRREQGEEGGNEERWDGARRCKGRGKSGGGVERE